MLTLVKSWLELLNLKVETPNLEKSQSSISIKLNIRRRNWEKKFNHIIFF
jgi:hypothetical protein